MFFSFKIWLPAFVTITIMRLGLVLFRNGRTRNILYYYYYYYYYIIIILIISCPVEPLKCLSPDNCVIDTGVLKSALVCVIKQHSCVNYRHELNTGSLNPGLQGSVDKMVMNIHVSSLDKVHVPNTFQEVSIVFFKQH